MADGIFVTGTDTGVGKTHVSRVVLHALRSAGIQAGAMKPVETGCAEAGGELVPADAAALAGAAGDAGDMSDVCPYRLKAALAPLASARLEGQDIDPLVILEAFARISSRRSFVVVEGAGGILVPMTESYDMLHLAEELGLPVLIVAASRLGAINHSLLTARVCMDRGLEVAGVVLNHLGSEPEEARGSNAEVLSQLLPVPVVELEHGADADSAYDLRDLILGLAR